MVDVDGRTPVPAPPQEGRWIAKPDRTPWYLKLGASVVLLGQLPNLLRMVLEPFVGKTYVWPVILSLSALVALVALGVCLAAIRRRAALRRKRSAMMDEGFGDQFVVEVTMVADGKHLGTDGGVLWFADGLVGFTGASSSFLLASSDVRSHQTPKTAKGRTTFPAGSLQLVGARRHAYVVISPASRDRKAYKERLRRFTLEFAPPDAERHWPPLVPYDGDARPLPAA